MLDELKYIAAGCDARIGKLVVHNPTLAEIRDYGERRYSAEMNALILRPYDAAVMLDEIGLNYQEISDFDLFTMTIRATLPDPSIFLPDVAFRDFQLGTDPNNNGKILYNAQTGVVIDELIYTQLVEYVRGIHFLKAAVEYDAGNTITRKYLIRKMKREAERRKRRPADSQYASIISSLVNNANCKYDYETIWQLKVSQFWDAFFRINKLQSYQNTMLGVYTGNVDLAKIDKEALSWFGRIDVNVEQKVDQSKTVAPTRGG